MKRNVRFIYALLKMKLSRSMVYRFSFFGGFFVDSMVFLMWLLMFQVIYSQVDQIGSWGKGEMTVFLGTFSLLNAINMTTYFFGVIGIPGKIKSGDLDHYITKPMNPLLRITFEEINLGSAPLILLSIGIIAYGISLAGITLSIGNVLLYTVFILIMAVLYYDMEVILRTVSFFVISVTVMEQIESTMFDLCMRIPGTLLKGGFRILFCVLLPYGLMATVPAQILLGEARLGGLLFAAGIGTVFTFFAIWFWKVGMRHYKSASS